MSLLTAASLDSVPPHFLKLLKQKYPQSLTSLLYLSHSCMISSHHVAWTPTCTLISTCVSPTLTSSLSPDLHIQPHTRHFIWMFKGTSSSVPPNKLHDFPLKLALNTSFLISGNSTFFSGPGQKRRIYPWLPSLYHISHLICSTSTFKIYSELEQFFTTKPHPSHHL